MRLFLDAGHYVGDPGKQFNGLKESGLTMKLRDVLVPLLGQKIEVLIVPDTLNLRESIDWINTRANINDVGLSIHFNAFSNPLVGGTETFYNNEREKHLAEIFSRNVSALIGIRNRGAKPDSQSFIGPLGWIRQLKCDSVLVEICFMTSLDDMLAYTPEKAASGFLKAIEEIVPRKVPEEAEKAGREADLVCVPKSYWESIVAAFTNLLNILKRLK